MTINEYFALKTQINQKWTNVIFKMVLAIFCFCITMVTTLTVGKSTDIVDIYIMIISIIAGVVLFILSLLKIVGITAEKENLENLYKDGKNLSEAAKILELIPDEEK